MNDLKLLPYEESKVKDWFDEVVQALPDGFIKDFILCTRGLISTTQFATWTALFCVSSVVKRYAWIKWDDGTGQLFANLYVFLVGPPYIVGKSCIAEKAERILNDYHLYLKDPETKGRKKVNLLRGSVTPEALFERLQPITFPVPEKKTVINEEGKEVIKAVMKNKHTDAEASMVISELNTFFSTKKYNEGLVGKMMDLYGCKNRDDTTTIKRGHRVVEDVYVTMLGCTTREDLHKQLPSAVFGNGFLSRVNIAYEPKPTREFDNPMPQEVVEDSEENLKKRLAHIADSVYKEYTLSKEAMNLYTEFVKVSRKKIIAAIEADKKIINFRYAQHVLKLSFLLCAQEYDHSNIITADHINQAIKILKATLFMSEEALSDIGATPFAKHLSVVANKLRSVTRITRRNLMQKLCYTRMPSRVTDECLEQLRQEGKLRIFNSLDEEQSRVSSNIRERYSYTGGKG